MHTDSASSSLLLALERHYDELVDYVRRRFGSRGFARDVVHDVCIEVIEKPPLETVHTPLAFLRRMSANRAIDWTRADAVRRTWIDSGPDVPDIHAHSEDGAQALDFAQQLASLVRIVEALPARARQVFILNRLYDMPQQEIADELGISRNMVAQHLARAMRSIEAEWAPAIAVLPPNRAKAAA